MSELQKKHGLVAVVYGHDGRRQTVSLRCRCGFLTDQGGFNACGDYLHGHLEDARCLPDGAPLDLGDQGSATVEARPTTNGLRDELATAVGDRVMQARVRALLRDTRFCVEATSFERLKLWEENHREVSWENDVGVGQAVGEVDGRPVCLELSWTRIDGYLVLFWEACSEVVDSRLIERWFDENCAPTWDGGLRRARSNAMNFHLCLDAIAERRALEAKARAR